MPVLQKAQDIYGYLPIEVQQMVSDGLGVSMSEIYGVVTFYSQFSLSPKENTKFLYVWAQLVTLRAPETYLSVLRSVWASPMVNAHRTASFLSRHAAASVLAVLRRY